MSTPRKDIADKIREDNPTYDVYDWPYEPAELRKVAVMVMREELDVQASEIGHQLTIQIYTPGGAPTASVEDTCDTALDNVLLSLQRLDVLGKINAKRVVLADKFQGWTVGCEWLSKNFYKTAVLEER